MLYVAETVAIAAGGAPEQVMPQFNVPEPVMVSLRVPETGSTPAQPSPFTPPVPRQLAACVVVHVSVTDSPETRVA